MTVKTGADAVPFDPDSFDPNSPFTIVGSGALGGTAEYLDRLRTRVLPLLDPEEFPDFEIGVPNLVVLTTELFDAFIEENKLREVVASGVSDRDIAGAFLEAAIPARYLRDLVSLCQRLETPLAVRPSTTLESELGHPLAGAYTTKMIPNNEEEFDDRFEHLCQAIQRVYASAFFEKAADCARRLGREPGTDRIAVILQEVVGRPHGSRFYPTISGSISSYNYYPTYGASPRDGVGNLALGLGKTIVDGGRSWVYCPAVPHRPPPFLNMRGLLKNSQTRFWAVGLDKPVISSPTQEEEFLARCGLDEAMNDGTLRYVSSTYDPQSDRLTPGTAGKGSRVVNFAPILASTEIPLNDLLQRLLEVSKEEFSTPVELEFALDLDPEKGLPARVGMVRVRPVNVSEERIEVTDADQKGESVLLASSAAMGNGRLDTIQDVVFVKPKELDPIHTVLIAAEIGRFDQALREAGNPYVLIGFGRWGTQDPWLGIPVTWGQIQGSKVLVEATLPQMNPELSQGAHFFQSMVAGDMLYLAVGQSEPVPIDWDWLDQQETIAEGDYIKHVRTAAPIVVSVDGRTGKGVIQKGV